MSNKSDARSLVRNKIFVAWLQICTIVEIDLRKLKHDPSELLLRMVQPVIWLVIFGQAMSHARAISTGSIPYIDFIAPGILAQSILFVSIFYGISLIWEKDAGILHKILVTPTPRIFLVVGRAIAAGLRGLSQACVVYLLSWLLGIHINLAPQNLLGVVVMVFLGSGIFATFSLIVALIVKKRERFMGIGQVLAMPLFFASNALYPIEMMPDWIRTISVLNPLSYQVDALRSLMILGETSRFGVPLDFGVSLLIFAVLAVLAAKLYPRIIY